jgi:hypothetical protein
LKKSSGFCKDLNSWENLFLTEIMRNQQTPRTKRGQVTVPKKRKMQFGRPLVRKNDGALPKITTGEKMSIGVTGGAIIGGFAGHAHHCFKSYRLNDKYKRASETGTREEFTAARQKRNEFMSDKTQITQVATAAGLGASGLMATILGITLLKKASDRLNRLAHKEQQTHTSKRQRSGLARLREAAIERREARLERRRRKKTIIIPNERKSLHPQPLAAAPQVSKKKQRQKTRGVPQSVTPEKQAQQIRTTKDAFGLSAYASRDINAMINATTKINNRFNLTILLRPKGVNHAPPPRWESLSPHGKRKRVALLASDCIREAKTRAPAAETIAVPYASIVDHSQKAFCPPALAILKIISRNSSIIIHGIPPKIRAEVKKITEFT